MGYDYNNETTITKVEEERIPALVEEILETTRAVQKIEIIWKGDTQSWDINVHNLEHGVTY